MDDWSLELRVVYEDPDFLEVETRVCAGEWSARSWAYASPNCFAGDVKRLIEWACNPQGPFRLEAGADTGIGWLVLDFFTINSAGHVRCAVTLAMRAASEHPRPTETWRFAIELRTEPGLIERFARQCEELARDHSGVAKLSGLPA